jgi:hypothetical protein
MKTKIMSAVAVAVAVAITVTLASAAPISVVASQAAAADRSSSPRKTEKWQGTAECTFVKDGKQHTVKASCFGQLSYESARSTLETSIRAQINSANGNTQGSITFSIKKEF